MINTNQIVYTVQVAPNVNALIEQVQEAINNGWMPIGGAFNYAGRFYQPMVLEIEITQEDCDKELSQDNEPNDVEL